jgi:hypothetical protein
LRLDRKAYTAVFGAAPAIFDRNFDQHCFDKRREFLCEDMMQNSVPAGRRRLWPVFVMPGLVLLLAVGWSGFWYFASSQISSQFDRWKDREAKAGRVYDCGQLAVGGYPFRFEVRCSNASARFSSQTASQVAIDAKVGGIQAVAQVYNPKLLIAEFTSPADVAPQGQPPLIARWSLAQASVYGLPEEPERVALVFDNPAVDRISSAVQMPYGRAKHLELHGKIAEGSINNHPVIDVALDLTAASAEGVHPLAAEPFDLSAQARISGLTNFAPKPWPERFREIQAAGGNVQIVQSRIQQGELIAVASGTLGLNANGQLDGELKMTIAGIEKIIPALGLDKIVNGSMPQATLDRVAPGLKTKDVDNALNALDKLMPGLGGLVRQQAPAAMAAGVTMLGEKTTLEGKPAQAIPLRFSDGAIFLGPVRVGDAPQLF